MHQFGFIYNKNMNLSARYRPTNCLRRINAATSPTTEYRV